VKTLITEGPMAAWEQLKEMAGEMKEAFIEAVKDFIKTKIIEQAIQWLVSLFVPGAGIIKAIVGIYDTIVFFIQKAKQIMQMVSNFLGSIAEIASGNIGAAADAMESGLARGLTLVINFLAALLRLNGITDKIKNAIQKIRAKVDGVLAKVAKWIAEKAKKVVNLITGKKEDPKKTTPADQPLPPGAKPMNFEVKHPFEMHGKKHHLIITVKDNKSDLLIASDPEKLIPAIIAAEKEVRSSARPKADKDNILDWLDRAHTEAKDVPFIVNAKISEVLHGKPLDAEKEKEAIAQAQKQELARIANVLFQLSQTWNVKALNDFFKAPPTRRYIPGASQSDIGKFIRSKLYDNMHDWTNVSRSFKTANFPKLKSDILGIQSDYKKAKNASEATKAKIKWDDYIDKGLILKEADINTHVPVVGNYDADHNPALATRWNNGGNDASDDIRGKQIGANLRLLTFQKNSSLGSGGVTYQPFVLSNFTSSIADGGIMYARNIDGKRFVDAAKQPIP
jgi:hypothetical protein